jgi:hypothetical protein
MIRHCPASDHTILENTAILGFSLCVLLLLISPVFADEEAQWNPPSVGPIATLTAPTVGKGKLAVQPSVFYNRTRGEFNDDGHYVPLPKGDKESQFQQEISAQYGITDKWEFDAQTVYQENYMTQGGIKAHDEGFGDSYLFTRYEFIEDKGWFPTTTGLLQIKMPTGKYQHEDPNKLGADLMGATTGGGSWDPGVGINLTKKLKPFIAHADFIASFPQQVRINENKTQYGNYFNCDAAVEYFLPKGFNLMMEVNGLLQGDKRLNGGMVSDSGTDSLTFAPGIGWSNDRIQLLIAYQRTLLGTNVDANDSIVATFVYSF